MTLMHYVSYFLKYQGKNPEELTCQDVRTFLLAKKDEGGGLTSKNKWKDNGTEFFLPIWTISRVFRGKYMEELKNLWNTNQLEFHGTVEKYRNHYAFKELINSCYDAEWVSTMLKPEKLFLQLV